MDIGSNKEINSDYNSNVNSSVSTGSNLCVKLEKGCQLCEESKTDGEMSEHSETAITETNQTGRSAESLLRKFSIPKVLKKKKQDTKEEAEPEVFHIPSNGNIIDFDVEEMCKFFSCFNVSPRLLENLRKKNVNGERFSRLTDTELDNIGLNNVVICYFRSKCKKNANQFML